ncbi:ABC transporter ATP-binding protein [Paraglaciecola sp. 2405UD69-4]|uniref:ABC transporter ATP-binding protein n=1 Tax=Paraglaciecola sp. 2405UD69-4 TaxID=3391836 RepID=UPI0039C937F2
MSQQASLIAKQVSYKVGTKPILSNIDLTVYQGEVLGVLGPNGAGKTSLLKIVSGQVACQGDVHWQQKTLKEYGAMERARQIAVVNQINEYVFSLDLQQIVRMGLLPHSSLLSKEGPEDAQNIIQAMKKVGLADKAKQTFSSLSGGEQQRGLIARALVQKAKLIVLDEPVNHLDVFYQHQVLQLLTSLAKDLNVTVIMSLHDVNLAAHYCDKIALLEQGKLIAKGTPETVLTPKLLTQVFQLPCEISKGLGAENFHINFYPPAQTANAQSGDF